jgi:hypothetical protein
MNDKIKAEKINKLKQEIEEKDDKLELEINRALENKDESLARSLKEHHLQCAAQLRLIRYIESDFEDTNYTIC